MVIWAEMTKRGWAVAGMIDGTGEWQWCGRGDVAVDVMMIVGSVLWRGPTVSEPRFRSGERGYDDNLFGRGYTREAA